MRDGGRIGSRYVPVKPEQQCPSPFALPTALIERKIAVDMTNGTPTLAVAPAGESSPSLCRIPCTPKGATMMAKGIVTPKRVVWKEKSALYYWQSKATTYIVTMGSLA
jgi:hypothetical protein